MCIRDRLVSGTLGRLIIPVYRFLGVDPAMFGSLLAIDMGGYQLSMELAENPLIGRYAGIVAASVFGCTIVFTIPVGMGLIEEGDRPVFAKGIMLGLAAMPAALITGAVSYTHLDVYKRQGAGRCSAWTRILEGRWRLISTGILEYRFRPTANSCRWHCSKQTRDR